MKFLNNGWCHCVWSGPRMSCNIWERGHHNVWCDPQIEHRTSWGTISNVSWHISLPKKLTWQLHRSRNKTFIRGASPHIPHELWDKHTICWRRLNIATKERKLCDMEVEIVTFVVKGSAQLTVPPNRQEYIQVGSRGSNSVGTGAFVIGLSQIPSFFLLLWVVAFISSSSGYIWPRKSSTSALLMDVWIFEVELRCCFFRVESKGGMNFSSYNCRNMSARRWFFDQIVLMDELNWEV